MPTLNETARALVRAHLDDDKEGFIRSEPAACEERLCG